MGTSEPFTGRPATIDLAEEPEFELGRMTVRPAGLTVQLDGIRRELQPRVMQVLVALAKARPAVVSRDKLIEQCWKGRVVGDDAINRVILSLRHLAQEFAPEQFRIETVPRIGHRMVESGERREAMALPARPGPRHSWWLKGLAAALMILGVGALFLGRDDRWPWQDGADVPRVLVAPATEDAVSRSLARDLAVNIGTLPGQSEPMRVSDLTGASRGGADLILTVGYGKGGPAISGTAVLRAGSDRVILWSKNFFERTGNAGNLRQQIAYTAAHVLRCALEGMTSPDPLPESMLKTYLNACADELDFQSRDYRPVVKSLEALVERAPRFAAGWAKLLSAEASAVQDFLYPDDAATIPSLRRHIAAARQIEPGLPEAYLAEYILMPSSNFVERGRLLEEAVRRNPSHARTRSYRAWFLGSVGRMDEAVREAREAARLDPLSPELRDAYVSALAAAGNVEGALAEVAAAERLWPGAASVVMARYRVHLRYGDPKEAYRLIQTTAVDSPAVPMQRAFIEARMDRSPRKIENAIRQSQAMFEDRAEAFDQYAQALAEFDRTEELIDAMLKSPRPDQIAAAADVLFRPAFGIIHRDIRFLQAAHRMGLLRYWEASGSWPDFCRAPDLPYDCRKEAAKFR